MNLSDFRISWRLLVQEPINSTVVILGLSVGFAACFLLLNYVHYSFTYDSHLPDSINTYVVKEKSNFMLPVRWHESAPFPLLGVAMGSDVVKEGARVKTLDALMKFNNVKISIDLHAVDPSFTSIFGVETIEGDLNSTLNRPDGLALTRSPATQLFGNSSAFGKIVTIGSNTFQVTAILNDPPTNTTMFYRALVGLGSAAWAADNRAKNINDMSRSQCKLYLRLKPSASRTALTETLQDALDQSPLRSQLAPGLVERLGAQKLVEIQLSLLSDAYFDPDLQGRGQRGDKQLVLALAAIALLVLILATINYVNLATIRLLRRQREISMRKVLGASVTRISSQFLAESLVVSFISTAIGLGLAELVLPAFSAVVDRTLFDLFRPQALLIGIMFSLVSGVAAGIYPAFTAWKNRPLQVLSGRNQAESISALWFRRCLTVLQFATAFGLSAIAVSITIQTLFSTNLNPGFDATPLLVIETPTDMRNANTRAFRDVVERLPGVDGVTSSRVAIGRNRIWSSGQVKSETGDRSTETIVTIKPVGSNFFDVYGIAPHAGRMFSEKLDSTENSDVVVINAATARALQFQPVESSIGQLITFSQNSKQQRSLRIIGIAPEIRNGTTHEPVQATVYMIDTETSILTIRIKRNDQSVRSQLETKWRKFYPNDEFEIENASAILKEAYVDDLHLTQILIAATLLSLTIAAFGIYSLSSYNVKRLTLQIVMRKLYGAKGRHIAMLLAREFIAPLTIGALIGIPISIAMIERYLATFSSTSSLGWTSIPITFGIIVIVVLLSTFKNVTEAMRLPPMQMLRE